MNVHVGNCENLDARKKERLVNMLILTVYG